MIGSERGKVLSSFLRTLPTSLRQEDEDEDEAEEADTAVEEEGGRMAEGLLQVPERLGDDEPAEVGGEVGEGVRPSAGPHWKNLGGDHPGEAAKAKVECYGEAQDERKGKPGDLATCAQKSLLFLLVSIEVGLISAPL